MTDIRTWNQTDASNTAAAPAGWPLSSVMFPNDVPGSGRAMMGAGARYIADNTIPILTTGTSTAYAVTIAQAATLATPLSFMVKWHVATGAAPTIAVNGLTAKNIKWANGTAVAANDFAINTYAWMFYDGTQFIVSTNMAPPFLNPMTTAGDIIYGGASGVPTRLAAGTSAQVLTGGSPPVWQAVNGTQIRMGSDAQGDVYYYNGTNVVRLGAGTAGQRLTTGGASANPSWASDRWVSLGITNAAGAASATLVALFDDTKYSRYAIEITGLVPATDATDLYMLVGTGGTPTYITANYNYSGAGAGDDGVYSGAGATSQAQMLVNYASTGPHLSNGSSTAADATILFSNPQTTGTDKIFDTRITFKSSAGHYIKLTGMGAYTVTGAITAIKFLMSSGNITGSFQLLGLLKA